MASSLLLLWIMLDSGNPNGFWQSFGFEALQYGEISTAVYLKVSISDFLTLFCARTGGEFFWTIPPGKMLLAGCVFALTVSSVLALFWPHSYPDGIETIGLIASPALFGFVWIFCLIFWIIQDILKVLCAKLLHTTNFCGVATTGVVVFPQTTLDFIKTLENKVDVVKHH